MSGSLRPHGLYSPWNSPGQNTWMGSLSFLQGIFPTQGLPHCRQILYQLSHQGSPRILEWVAYPFSGGSSQPRNRTGVSCTAEGFFIGWAIREALSAEWVLLFPWLHLPLLKPIIGECSRGRQISLWLSLIHRGLLRYLSAGFLLPVLQSCSFQVPDHPATPLVAAHKLVYNRIPGHFSSHTEWTAWFTAPGSVHCGDLPWPPPLWDPVTPISLRLPNLVAAAPTKTSDLQKRVKSLGVVKGVSYPPRVSEQIFFLNSNIYLFGWVRF